MITVNIGLKTRSKERIDPIEVVLNIPFPKKWKTVSGKYTNLQGEEIQEKTLILEYHIPYLEVKHICEFLVEKFDQECIAIYNHETKKGDLVWNPDVEGEKFEFDVGFFHFIEEKTLEGAINEMLSKGNFITDKDNLTHLESRAMAILSNYYIPKDKKLVWKNGLFVKENGFLIGCRPKSFYGEHHIHELKNR